MKKQSKQVREYRLWIIQHPCKACGIEDDTRVPHHLTFIKGEAAMGGKAAEKYLVCLCYNCHIEKLHRHGEKKFWIDLKYTLDEIEMFALDLYTEYLMRKL